MIDSDKHQCDVHALGLMVNNIHLLISLHAEPRQSPKNGGAVTTIKLVRCGKAFTGRR